MSDGPDDPVKRWNLPFESVPRTEAVVEAIIVDSVTVLAVVVPSDLGPLPGVSLSFATSGVAAEDQIPPILLVAGNRAHMAEFRRLIAQAMNAAIRQAEAEGGR